MMVQPPIVMTEVPPCKDCQVRTVGCHGRCEAYRKYAAKCAHLRELRLAQSLAKQDFYDNRIPMIKKKQHSDRKP